MTAVTKDVRRGVAQLRQIEDAFLSGTASPVAMRESLQRIIEKRPTQPLSALAGPFPTKVRYGRSLEKGVKAGGYDEVDEIYGDSKLSDWSTQFVYEPLPTHKATLQKEFWVLDLGKYVPSDNQDRISSLQALFFLFESLGLAATTVEDLLAFAEQHPEFRSERTLYAAGSYRRYPDEATWQHSYIAGLEGGTQRELTAQRDEYMPQPKDLYLVYPL